MNRKGLLTSRHQDIKVGATELEMAWWKVSFVCPTGWEDDFASALGELTAAPACAEPCETGMLVWTSFPDGPRPFCSRELELSLDCLAASLGVPAPRLEVSRATEEEWLQKWKEFFSPVVIGGKLLVRPPWIAPGEEGPGKDVVIRPGLAFGTGLHATTKMCLEFIGEMVKPGDVVLDVGAGSGILSIAACKLGAQLAVAVDNDLVALGECRRNCQENGVEKQVLLLAGSLLTALRGRWNLLVCNIDAGPACEVAREADNYLAPDGGLILAGFTTAKEQEVSRSLADGFFQVEGHSREGPWACLAARSQLDRQTCSAGLQPRRYRGLGQATLKGRTTLEEGNQAVQRIFVERDWLEGDRILVPSRERHYLANVLRLGHGGTFRAILDGEAEMEAVLEQVSPRAIAKIVSRKPVPAETDAYVILLQAHLKAPRMAWLVQKATELGANRLLITTTERTIPRPRAGRQSLERWKTIAHEAAEQCGATRLPKLEGPLPFAEALRACEGEGLRLLLWEGEAPHLRGFLSKFFVGDPCFGLSLTGGGDACVAPTKGRAEHIFVAVGPEGGFTPSEVEMAQAAGFTPVSLGSRILRAETAAIAALAILRFAFP